jgi:hypothetical protein
MMPTTSPSVIVIWTNASDPWEARSPTAAAV